MGRLALALSALAAIGLAAAGIANLAQARDGVRREMHLAGGTPIELFIPAGATGRSPAVVVSHGFSGNRQLMYGFGYTLARNGYVAGLIDYAGHGGNARRLPESPAGDAQYAALAGDLDAALAFMRGRTDVDPARVAILGHSMGASAVARYGAAHPDVPATIAISLGEFGGRLPARADAPRNLLIMVGALEFAGFVNGSTAGLRAAYPDGAPGATYGDAVAGTARRLFVAPGVEHITILFSPDAYVEMVRWLDATLGGFPAGRPVHTDARMGWVLALYLAAAIGFRPLAHAVFARSAAARPAWGPGVHGGLAALIAVAAAVIAPLALRVVPYRWMPVTVGNYVGVYFAVFAAVVAAAALAASRGAITARLRASWDARLLPGTAALTAYALVTFGLPAHLEWTSFALPGARGWVAGVVFAFAFAFFLADEALAARDGPGRRAALYALSKLLVVASLTAAVFAFGAPGFLLLLVPVIAILFVWHSVYAHWLFGLTRAPWAAGVVNAAVFAWVIAATFALVAD